MLRVGVIGATGYTGEEVVRILAGHKDVRITVLQAVIEKEESISSILPSLKGKIDLIIKEEKGHTVEKQYLPDAYKLEHW